MAKNVADQKDMEEQLKKEAPFSKQHEKERGKNGSSMNNDREAAQQNGDDMSRNDDPMTQQNGQRYGDDISRNGDPELQQPEKQGTGDNHSKQGESDLQEKYRDSTSMQGDIKRQQQKDGNAANGNEGLQQKYGHRDDDSPPMSNDQAFQQDQGQSDGAPAYVKHDKEMERESRDR